MTYTFTKMQAAGNDYLYFDCRTGGLPPREKAAALAVQLSRRRFSVGGDGAIFIGPPLLADGDAAMYIYNADGSEATMCGNGVRCVAEYLYTHGGRRPCIKIDTPQAGRRTLHRIAPHVWQAEMGHFTARAAKFPAVGLGRGQLLQRSLTAAGQNFTVDCISVGNPHCVILREDLPTAAQLAAWGMAIEKHPAFPAGVNVEFVRVVSSTCLQVSVWERGSGATLACGTGACAAAAAMTLRGICLRDTPVTVQLPGGDLTVCVAKDDTLTLTGPAKTVFEGKITIDSPN